MENACGQYLRTLNSILSSTSTYVTDGSHLRVNVECLVHIERELLLHESDHATHAQGFRGMSLLVRYLQSETLPRG